MENPVYHVLLEGRRIGPYDRRTIVGMRMKKTLTSSDVLVAGNGMQLTVADLVKRPEPDAAFEASRSGSYSVVQAMYSAWVADTAGYGIPIPAYKGEVEVRLQTRALRISGRYRQGFGWKQDRVKIALPELAHVRLRGSMVDLALRNGDAPPRQRLTLELFTPEAATEFAAALPAREPWPDRLLPARGKGEAGVKLVWAAVAATALVVGGIFFWILTRRF